MPSDYDLILTGDLGFLGKSILIDAFRNDKINIEKNYEDCGVMIFDKESQDTHCGGSGCGCSASVLCGHILNSMKAGSLNKILFCATGALLSPITSQQGESIPSVCHLIEISNTK